MKHAFCFLFSVILLFGALGRPAAVFAEETAPPEVIEVTVGISPADYKALTTDPEKIKYNVYAKINDGTYNDATVNIRGYSSKIIGMQTKAKRIPFELKFADSSVFSDAIANKSVKFINSFTPYRLIAEYLALELYAYAGIPTPAHSFAFVRFNDVDLGVYIAVEDLNKTFLKKWYDNDTHYLLKATPDADKADTGIDSSKWFGPLFEKEGSDTESIRRLLDALNRGTGYEELINTDEWLRFFACIAVTGGEGSVFTELNNIALYNNNGRFELIPWDLSEAFTGAGTRNGIDRYYVNEESDRLCPLFELLMKTPKNKEKYHSYIRELNEGFLKPEHLQKRYNGLLNVLEPYLERDRSVFLKGSTTVSELRSGGSAPPNNLLYTLNGMYENLNAQLDGTASTYFRTEIDSGLNVTSLKALVKYYEKNSPQYDASLPKKIKKAYYPWAKSVGLDVKPDHSYVLGTVISVLGAAAAAAVVFAVIRSKRKKAVSKKEADAGTKKAENNKERYKETKETKKETKKQTNKKRKR